MNDKSRAFFQRYFSPQVIMVGSEIGRLPPQFGAAAKIANAILNCGHEFDKGKLVYNYYKSVVSYDTKEIPIFSNDTVTNADNVSVYGESVVNAVLKNFYVDDLCKSENQ